MEEQYTSNNNTETTDGSGYEKNNLMETEVKAEGVGMRKWFKIIIPLVILSLVLGVSLVVLGIFHKTDSGKEVSSGQVEGYCSDPANFINGACFDSEVGLWIFDESYEVETGYDEPFWSDDYFGDISPEDCTTENCIVGVARHRNDPEICRLLLNLEALKTRLKEGNVFLDDTFVYEQSVYTMGSCMATVRPSRLPNCNQLISSSELMDACGVTIPENVTFRSFNKQSFEWGCVLEEVDSSYRDYLQIDFGAASVQDYLGALTSAVTTRQLDTPYNGREIWVDGVKKVSEKPLMYTGDLAYFSIHSGRYLFSEGKEGVSIKIKTNLEASGRQLEICPLEGLKKIGKIIYDKMDIRDWSDSQVESNIKTDIVVDNSSPIEQCKKSNTPNTCIKGLVRETKDISFCNEIVNSSRPENISVMHDRVVCRKEAQREDIRSLEPTCSDLLNIEEFNRFCPELKSTKKSLFSDEDRGKDSRSIQGCFARGSQDDGLGLSTLDMGFFSIPAKAGFEDMIKYEDYYGQRDLKLINEKIADNDKKVLHVGGVFYEEGEKERQKTRFVFRDAPDGRTSFYISTKPSMDYKSSGWVAREENCSYDGLEAMANLIYSRLPRE
jgi:hypothetical protein